MKLTYVNSSLYTRLNKKFILILAVCISVFACYTLVNDKENIEDGQYRTTIIFPTFKSSKFLINTSSCKIPDVNPFNEETERFYQKYEPFSCSRLELLTYIDKSDSLATLRINRSLFSEYSFFNIKCCYSKIYRIDYLENPDNKIRYSPCTEFYEKVVLSYPFVKVECSNFLRNVYSNVHATVLPIQDINIFKNDNKTRFSVLLVGIDSMSNLNIRRTMPKSYAYLEKHFLNLKGYNKISDNTFPNLLAVLTGQDYEFLTENCRGNVKFDKCDIIWYTFRKLGYVTAYAEDCSNIETFHYYRTGFGDPPTDYYYRPYLIASEELRSGHFPYCSGPESAGERILNSAKDFSISFKEVPSFGFFWTSSFSHDDVNMPSAMDEKVLDFLSDADFVTSLRNTIMVFFSDHGIRYGISRSTYSGWLEERLPFIFFRIPESFKKSFKEKYINLRQNTYRLSTPYDLYNTLQEILEIGDNSYSVKKSSGCSDCQSLFKRIPENRTCKGAAISQHWCTCTGYRYINPKTDFIRPVAQFIIDEINALVQTFTQHRACSIYSLKKIVSAGISDYYLNEMNVTVRYFLLIIESRPFALFETTVENRRMSEQDKFKLLGGISRLNRYEDDTKCVDNGGLKKYCFCD